MKLPALLIADLHLTASPRDEYRWALFPWLRRIVYEDKVKTLNILGDLSDAKDFHPSPLVNRIAQEMRLMVTECPNLAINMIPGNHEWMKQGEEFWRFLNHLGDGRIRYMTTPGEDPDVSGPRAYFLPFTKTPNKDWANMNFEDYDYVFMHQTLRGSIASNGEAMPGEELPEDVLATARKVYSGDIHVPQVVGCVEYVGSPYHVHFGDDFKPRVVLLETNGRPVDLHMQSPRRVMLKVGASTDNPNLDILFLKQGDHVKLRVELGEADKHAWQSIRREWLALLKRCGVEVHGVELVVQKSRRRLAEGQRQRSSTHPADAVTRYVMAEELGATALDIALELLE